MSCACSHACTPPACWHLLASIAASPAKAQVSTELTGCSRQKYHMAPAPVPICFVINLQVAHTWCLLSGSCDGQVLLWRSEAPADSGDQQLSGAAMLAQLVPHMRLTEVSCQLVCEDK
jgi:hypothetical protein